MAFDYDLILAGPVGRSEAFSAVNVYNFLAKNPDKEVNVLIDSLGGESATALSIAAAFRKHGNVNVHFSGYNASAATIVALGAKHVSMDSCGLYLIHKAAFLIDILQILNADGLQQCIDNLMDCKLELNQLDNIIASMYASRCSKTTDELLSLMGEERWLTAEEAREWGFVDEIVDFNEGVKAQSSGFAEAIAILGLPEIPESHRHQRKATNEQPATGQRAAKSPLEVAAEKVASIFKKHNIKQTMQKVYTICCSILGVEALDVTEGNVAISEQQLDSIEAALEKANNEISEKADTIASLEARIAELSAKPGDVSPAVVDETRKARATADAMGEFMNTAVSAKKLFDSLP